MTITTNETQTQGSLALKPTATVINLPVAKKEWIDSSRTSRGIKKAEAADPIREAEDIVRIAEYLLTHGKNQWYGYRNRMAFVLGVSTGLRVSDLLRIKIEDVLNEDGTIVDYLRIQEKKTRKYNDPKIGTAAKTAISEYLASLESFTREEYLIRSERGGKLDESQLYRTLSAVEKGLNLPYHFSTHTMRKTYGYWTIRNNPNDNMALIHLQMMFNHSSPQTTLTYCGINREEEDKYYNGINEMFSM